MKNKLTKVLSCTLIVLSLIFYWGCEDTTQGSSYLFKLIKPSHSNIKFRNVIPEDRLTNFFFYEYVYNGGGVAVGDLNGDDLVDIYFTSNLHENALYINKGDFRFEEVAVKSGVQGKQGWTTGVSMVDINNDNLLDIYLCKSGPYENKELLQNELYINNGPDKNGIPIFKESAKEYGLNDPFYSIQSAFLDFDLDGDLDLYLMNHNPQTFAIGNTEEFSPLGDKFYINENGQYVDKTKEVGIYSNAVSYGLGVGVGDLNNDGWPDIYISNDYDEPDYLYLNNKNGTFKEIVKKATNHISNFAMGNDIADFDNDGFLDILTLDMVSEDNYGMKTSMASMNPEKFAAMINYGKHYQYMYNTLQKHTTYIDSAGVPYFSEVGQMAGLSNTDWSWAPLLADFDNDGKKDIFITNGIKRDFRNKDFFNYLKKYKKENYDALTNPEKITALVKKTPHRPNKNYFYKNIGGMHFENTSNTWLKNPEENYSNGAAYADLDNDGDLDLVINNVDEPATILENTASNNGNHFLYIKLKGPEKNTQGLGVKIKIYTPEDMHVFEHYNVRGYQSCVPPGIHVGLGQHTIIDSVIVTWPNGEVQLINNPAIDKVLLIKYETSPNASVNNYEQQAIYFSKINSNIKLQHKENDYNDYKEQVLLPHKMSQFGPAIAIGDINGDGRDDLYFGQSTGEVSRIFSQQKDGSFIEAQAFEEDAAHEDVDAAFFDMDSDGDLDLYVASGGNEFEPNDPLYSDRIYENVNGRFTKRSELLEGITPVSSSRIRVNDYDKDDYPDIFIGGRHIPHHYPSPTSSYLLHNQKGTFKEVSSTVAPDLNTIGMVTDATWSDYDSDGDADLCVVGEWMSPLFLENENGQFKKATYDLMSQLTGWYFSISSEDIDGDGDMDFILGNLGENYKYKANKDEPFEVYYDDFDDNGKNDLVLGYHNFGDLFPVRGRECSSQQIPEIKEISPTYHDFGKSTLVDIYGKEKLNKALHLKAYNFKSGILKNNGSSNFEFIAFPELAQLSSINSILSKDLNGDGKNELIIAGNLFTSEIETPRNDAGYGLVLKNNGSCDFEPINATESGLFLNGDVKVLRFLNMIGNTILLAGNNNALASFYGINQKIEIVK